MASILNALKQLQQNGISFAESTPATSDELKLSGLKRALAEPPERHEARQPVAPSSAPARSARTKGTPTKLLELPTRLTSELSSAPVAQNVRTYEQIVGEADDTLDHLVELVEHQNTGWETPATKANSPASGEISLVTPEHEIDHAPYENATENESQLAPGPEELSADSDELSYEQAVTDIVIGGTSYADRSESTEAIAGALAMLSLPLDCVGVDCIDAGITSSELVPLEDDAEFDTSSELVEDKPIRSEVNTEWIAEEVAETGFDLPVVAESVESASDFAINAPKPILPSEPLSSTITEPLPAAKELATELPSQSLHETPSLPSDELLPEDILSVLAEVERNHEPHDSLRNSRVVAVPSLQITSARRATNIRSLDRNANATLSQQAMDMLLSEAATAFPAGWQEPETSPSYADLLADEPLEELADWGYLVGTVEPHGAPTAVDTSDTQAVSPPRPSLQPEEIRSPSLELPRRPLPARPTETEHELEAEEGNASEELGRTDIPADIVSPEQPAVAPIQAKGVSSKPNAPTAFEFELMRHLDDQAVRNRYLELAENLWPASSTAPRNQRTVILCSVDRDAQVAQTVARLATLYATERQVPVLMIDANLTQQHLTKGYLAQGNVGFADLLAVGTPPTVEPATPTPQMRATSNGRVALLPAGGRIDRRRIETDIVRQRVSELGEQYPLILIDGGVASDELAAKIAHGGDEVYLVVQIGKTTRQAAEQAKASLIAAGITPAGCVATNVPIDS